MHDENLRQLIDACRPGRDDQSLPEMAELARRAADDSAVREICARSERWDAALSDAFHDVAVPDSLEQALLAAVSGGSAATAELEPTGAVSPDAPVVKRRGMSFNRRLGMIAAGAAAVAALLLAAVFLPRDAQLSAEAVAERTPGWIDSLPEDGWRDVGAAPPPNQYADGLRGLDVAMAVDRWQPADFPGARGAAFTDSRPLAVPAVLMVLTARGAGSLPAAPPPAPFSQTGGWQVGVWQGGRFVYVLAVQGSRQDYLKVASPRGPIVFWRPAADDFS